MSSVVLARPHWKFSTLTMAVVAVVTGVPAAVSTCHLSGIALLRQYRMQLKADAAA